MTLLASLALVLPIWILITMQPPSTSAGHDNPALVPFKVDISNSQLKDLKYRLKNARITHPALKGVDDFSYGFNVPTLKKFKDYWLNKFDWKKQEKVLNTYPQFRTEIEGLMIHFIHAKPPNPSKYKKVIPLLLAHGWPGSTYEFYKIIPMLIDPNSILGGQKSDIAFEVVVPSLPGFGFSDQPEIKGFNQMSDARVFNTLMVDRLKYNKYMAQGGDWGFVVVSNLAKMFPDRLIGIHLNDICHLPFNIDPISENLGHAQAYTPTEELKEAGYFLESATKPDTVGIGMNDSPIGLMAYMLEKVSSVTNYDYIFLPDGGLTLNFTMDELLTDVSIYWFNGNAVSTQRHYKEFFEDRANQNITAQYCTIPTGYGAGPHNIPHCMRVSPAVANAAYNICQYTAFPKGGHFAPLEQPKVLAVDVLNFAVKVLNGTCSH